MKKILVVFLMGIFAACNVYAANPKELHEKYLKFLDNRKNAKVSVPNQHVFDGMKQYDKKDVKFSKDGSIAYDLKGNLLTGVVVINPMRPQMKKSFKNGKAEGPAFWQNGNHIIFTDMKHNFSKGKQILLQEFLENRLIKESVITDAYTYSRQYQSSGVLHWEIISNKNAEIIMRGYDKNGKKRIEIDTFVPSAICILSDGSQRNAKPEEVERFLDLQEKSAANLLEGKNSDEGIDFACQE